MEDLIIQNRQINSKTIGIIKSLIRENPHWNRTRISKELCKLWDWRNDKGQLKDMACRTMLLKLAAHGHITLPMPERSSNNYFRNKSFQYVLHSQNVINTKLREIIPLKIIPVENREDLSLFRTYIALYHYLGYSGTVGENIKYLVFNNQEHPVACFLFGAAAWKVEKRDKFIGWDKSSCRQKLQFIANNMRFLVLPWVHVKYLASFLLGKIASRISNDWQDKYGHPIYLLETFVERDRYKGICYQASNWQYVGQTKGRTRNDRYFNIQVPVKDVYLYPLCKDFRDKLKA